MLVRLVVVEVRRVRTEAPCSAGGPGRLEIVDAGCLWPRRGLRRRAGRIVVVVPWIDTRPNGRCASRSRPCAEVNDRFRENFVVFQHVDSPGAYSYIRVVSPKEKPTLFKGYLPSGQEVEVLACSSKSMLVTFIGLTEYLESVSHGRQYFCGTHLC
jgi:hypothetical protein